MMLRRLLRVDVREGLRAIAPWLGLYVAVCAVNMVGLALTAASQGRSTSFTFMERYFALFGGITEVRPVVSEPFVPPVAWLAQILCCLYAVLWYPYRNLRGYGAHVMLAGGARASWWLSKCVWTVLAVSICWLIGLAVAAVGAMLDGGFAPTVGEALLWAQRWSMVPDPSVPLFAWFVVGVLVLQCAFALVQLLVSLVAHPLAGFAVSISLLLLSALYLWMPGSWLMAARSAALQSPALDPRIGVAMGVAASVLAAGVGAWTFSRVDLIGGGDEDDG